MDFSSFLQGSPSDSSIIERTPRRRTLTSDSTNIWDEAMPQCPDTTDADIDSLCRGMSSIQILSSPALRPRDALTRDLHPETSELSTISSVPSTIPGITQMSNEILGDFDSPGALSSTADNADSLDKSTSVKTTVVGIPLHVSFKNTSNVTGHGAEGNSASLQRSEPVSSTRMSPVPLEVTSILVGASGCSRISPVAASSTTESPITSPSNEEIFAPNSHQVSTLQVCPEAICSVGSTSAEVSTGAEKSEDEACLSADRAMSLTAIPSVRPKTILPVAQANPSIGKIPRAIGTKTSLHTPSTSGNKMEKPPEPKKTVATKPSVVGPSVWPKVRAAVAERKTVLSSSSSALQKSRPGPKTSVLHPPPKTAELRKNAPVASTKQATSTKPIVPEATSVQTSKYASAKSTRGLTNAPKVVPSVPQVKCVTGSLKGDAQKSSSATNTVLATNAPKDVPNVPQLRYVPSSVRGVAPKSTSAASAVPDATKGVPKKVPSVPRCISAIARGIPQKSSSAASAVPDATKGVQKKVPSAPQYVSSSARGIAQKSSAASAVPDATKGVQKKVPSAPQHVSSSARGIALKSSAVSTVPAANPELLAASLPKSVSGQVVSHCATGSNQKASVRGLGARPKTVSSRVAALLTGASKPGTSNSSNNLPALLKKPGPKLP